MKACAAVFWGVGRPLTVEVVDLREPRAGEVVVRMAAAGICGTDLHSLRGELRRPTPMVLGHEGTGVVEAVGEGVERLAPGDEVVLSWAPSCGECFDCVRRRRPAACPRLHAAIGAGTLVDGTTGISLRGETVYRGTATGCFAERVVVSERVALSTGGAVALEEAALLGCAALTGVGACLYAARVEAGESVVVVGAGGVGQFAVQGARIAGAETIVAIDPLAPRRELALALGATHALAPEEAEAELADILPEGADVGLDAVGEPATTAMTLALTRSGGRTVLVGLPAAGA
ncbi:MAG: alcohol dehydrogenase catalytic domain-containing protein, partial [Gaiellaceae bacterium]|nr:alcohol dehydrogenase catalytic domain-containing protein [Gaiellaceae bacterium]